MTAITQPTALEWAREHGTPFDFTVQLGAVTANMMFGKGWRYTHPVENIGPGILIEQPKRIPQATKAIYTLNDPAEELISLWYCAGWHDEQDVMFLHEVSPIVLTAPERCFHLRVVAHEG